jgi:single-strand DNA-binding protein
MSEQMNLVILTGRPTKDPEISRNSETTVAHFSLAVNRRKNREGVEEADFPRITLFGGLADFSEKYVRKGKMIQVAGRIQTGSYTNKDGEKVYTTDVVVDRLFIIEWPEEGQQDQQVQQPPQGWSYPQQDAQGGYYSPQQYPQQPLHGMMPMPGEPYGRNNW